MSRVVQAKTHWATAYHPIPNTPRLSNPKPSTAVTRSELFSDHVIPANKWKTRSLHNNRYDGSVYSKSTLEDSLQTSLLFGRTTLCWFGKRNRRLIICWHHFRPWESHSMLIWQKERKTDYLLAPFHTLGKPLDVDLAKGTEDLTIRWHHAGVCWKERLGMEVF